MKNWENLLVVAVGTLIAVGLVLGLFVGAMALGAFVVQWSWNLVIPAVFNLAAIDYWQAFGLLLLISILGRLLIPIRLTSSKN